MKFALLGAAMVIAFIITIVAIVNPKDDNINYSPKPECPFEGAECPNVQKYLRDYQLEYHNDTLWIYDADRLVGIHIDYSSDGINHGEFIDVTVLKDNL